MANRKTIMISVVVLIILFCAGYYLMYASKRDNAKELPNATETLGTNLGAIDINKVVKQHPEYQKLLQLKKEYNDLAAETEGMKDFKVDAPMPAADTAALGNSAQQMRSQKIKAKQAELNERLGKKDAEFRSQFSAQHEAEVKAIDEQYLPQIFNLQLKLDTLQIDKDVAVELLNQMNQLKSQHSQKVRENQQKFLSQIAGMMKAEQEKAMQELNAYVLSVDQQIGKDVQAKQGEIEARNHLAMQERTNELRLEIDSQAAAKRKLMDKEKEIVELESKIRADIDDKTAKIATMHKLEAVLSAVKVNINAMDITDLVIEEFKK